MERYTLEIPIYISESSSVNMETVLRTVSMPTNNHEDILVWADRTGQQPQVVSDLQCLLSLLNYPREGRRVSYGYVCQNFSVQSQARFFNTFHKTVVR